MDLFNFLKRKGYNMTLSDSHPMNSNFRFFNLNNRWALQIGNYRITEDGDHDLIELEKEYKKFIRNIETQRSAKEIGIFIVTNNINIKKLEDITSTERKIIICHFNELDGYIEQIEQEHMNEMLKLHNDIFNAENCIDNSNSIEELKDNLKIIMSHLEKFGDIKNIMSYNSKKYNNIKDLDKALKNLNFLHEGT
ncbi:29992_t:CDS:2 [Gigaspora margarita]|uniref:29992_t:CDS:1 n=1 Tax=Gigaspora margarita TaxID=4874 RepID=A0ABN7UUZ1_GIGMA|nr:29992_t:CDS:2 [Gigaspora margarita]